jgi:hypothetical protein
MSDDMLKVLWPAQTAAILNDGLSSIGGPVVRATDLRSTDPAALLSAWGWADLAPYGSPPEVVDVLRFPMHPLMRTRTPTALDDTHVPTYAHGFLPSVEALIPVFDLAHTRVPTGTELWRLRLDTAPDLKLIFDGPARGWRQGPSYFPPLHVVGPRARWHGHDLPAAFTEDTSALEIVWVGAGAPDGFEQTRPSVSRRTVTVGECDSVFEVELTAQIHGIPVRVLQRAGEQALVLLTGISRDDGARLGATEVEPGPLRADDDQRHPDERQRHDPRAVAPDGPMTGAPLNLDDLAARITSERFGEYVDFFIANRADKTLTSSELVCLSFRDDVYSVLYRDAGESRDLLRTPDPAEAERVFVQETRRLVDARYPGRRLPEQGDT